MSKEASAYTHKLGTFSVTMIVVSLIMGMGIFKIPALIAATSGTKTIFFTALALGGLMALMGALTYAEIGARLPVMGAITRFSPTATTPRWGLRSTR